jgi:asparagine synthase (glutamine-hydrolysing)
MCGIFGMVGNREHAGLREAALTLRHRGPDGFGDWSSPDQTAYLAHCRLSIIDLSEAGRQPMANEDGSVQLTFNGEIYNFAELRKELVAAGHHFASKTDSEVIVHGYEQWGDDVIARLRGMFALALWDEKRRRLLLARDHLGVKPLYYALHGDRLAFASETRALLPTLAKAAEPDVDALFGFLRHGYVQGSRSIWRGIARLAPGTQLSFDADSGAARIRRYWNPATTAQDWSPDAATEAVRSLLDEAVAEQLVSDVPVGVFLSGGIDSSLIAASARLQTSDLKSFFADFVGWGGSERDDAAAAAASLGTHHHVEAIDQASVGLSDPERARELFAAFDEPIGDMAIVPTWHLARHIRRHVGVALSGDGGDELFGGYARYRQIRSTPRRQLAWRIEQIRRRFGWGRDWPQGCASQDEYYHLLHCPSFNRQELATLFPQWSSQALSLRAADWPEIALESAHADQRRWQHIDLHTYLVDNNLARVDRASMAHGLEVRVPLLDHRVAELALSLPLSMVDAIDGGKPLLRRLAAKRLPAKLLSKPKQGFSFPMSRLIDESALVASLRTGVLVRRQLLDRDGLEGWLSAPRLSNHDFKLWLLFVLEHWARQWLLREDPAA